MSKLHSNQTGPVQSIFQSDQGRWSSARYSDIAACRIMSQMVYITVHSIKGAQCHWNLQSMLFSFHANGTIWSLNWNNSIRLTTKRPWKCTYWEQMHCSYGTGQHNHSSRRFFFLFLFSFESLDHSPRQVLPTRTVSVSKDSDWSSTTHWLTPDLTINLPVIAAQPNTDLREL